MTLTLTNPHQSRNIVTSIRFHWQRTISPVAKSIQGSNPQNWEESTTEHQSKIMSSLKFAACSGILHPVGSCISVKIPKLISSALLTNSTHSII